MHLIETYALACGLKIEKPLIKECFYPGLPEKFILFNPHSKGLGRFYNKWQEVINLIYPFLESEKISIIQIDSFDKKYNFCTKISESSFNHTAFITSKCSLLLGIDSFCMHLANSYGKPMVILYSATTEFNNSKPYFGDLKLCKFFIPERNGLPAFYGLDAAQEYINQHNPKDISDAVIQLLSK